MQKQPILIINRARSQDTEIPTAIRRKRQRESVNILCKNPQTHLDVCDSSFRNFTLLTKLRLLPYPPPIPKTFVLSNSISCGWSIGVGVACCHKLLQAPADQLGQFPVRTDITAAWQPKKHCKTNLNHQNTKKSNQSGRTWEKNPWAAHCSFALACSCVVFRQAQHTHARLPHQSPR